LPIKADLKQIINNVVEECNQYGGFLPDDLIVTNVKVLSRSEISKMLHNSRNQMEKDNSFDELDT